MENKMDSVITTQRIHIDMLRKWMDMTPTPVNIEPIPGMTIPQGMGVTTGIKITNGIDNDIRSLCNALTASNTKDKIQALQKVIKEKMRTTEDLTKISNEFLQFMLRNKETLSMYFAVLNACHQLSILIQTESAEKKTLSVGSGFIEACRNTTFTFLNETTVREMAMLDQTDNDDLDKYNKYFDKVIIMMVILSQLYSDSFKEGVHLKLRVDPICSVFNKMYDGYETAINKIIELGNPEIGEDCQDETEFMIQKNISIMYATLMIEMLSHCGNLLMAETKDFKMKNGLLMKLPTLIGMFKDHFSEHLYAEFLVVRAANLTV